MNCLVSGLSLCQVTASGKAAYPRFLGDGKRTLFTWQGARSKPRAAERVTGTEILRLHAWDCAYMPNHPCQSGRRERETERERARESEREREGTRETNEGHVSERERVESIGRCQRCQFRNSETSKLPQPARTAPVLDLWAFEELLDARAWLSRNLSMYALYVLQCRSMHAIGRD